MAEEIYEMKLYGVETPNGAVSLTFFPTRDTAMAWAEKRFDPDGDQPWSKISKKHGLKIVKVIVRKEKW